MGYLRAYFKVKNNKKKKDYSLIKIIPEKTQIAVKN